uniref:Transmembrane protein 100 n=1 Tax=Sander lucioperca TaxID=283035 RepID=A0A8D0AKJ0_SANLU
DTHTTAAFLASLPRDSNSEMGCSSGRQTPAPVLHPDLVCGSNEANNLPQDSENQNQGLTRSKPPESVPTLERLAQATGGTEKSWYRCVFPFGVISLVIGMAGTGVTFTFDTLLQTKVVSVALLCAGVVMLLVAAVCWRAHRQRRRKKKESGFFTADQGTL